MDLAWRLTCTKAVELGLVSAGEIGERFGYNTTIYRRFFDHLLRHRNGRAIDIDSLFSGGGSAHDVESGVSELIATPDEAVTAIADVEAIMNAEQAAGEVANWYRV